MAHDQDNSTVKRRGRPRAYDPVAALANVQGAFWKSGYSGTSLDDISAATGMNRPSLSAAFGDKRALYVAALRGYWVAKFAAMHDALDGGTLEAALTRAYDASLALYFSGQDGARGCFVVGTAITESVEDPEIREIVRAGFETLDANFEARFRLAQTAGEIAADADCVALATLTTATMHTLAIRSRAGTPCDDLREIARKAVKVICG
jgi:AcrR family transcriptional regulator